MAGSCKRASAFASCRKRASMPGVQAISDRKSTRLNSSHLVISYAVFCLKKKKYYQHAKSTPSHETPAYRTNSGLEKHRVLGHSIQHDRAYLLILHLTAVGIV